MSPPSEKVGGHVSPVPHQIAPMAIRVARWPAFHRPDRYFTANLAEAGILKISA